MGKISLIAGAVVAVAASALLPASVSAHTIYPLQGNQWAIICDDGTGWSFSGSQTGAGEVAGLLCGSIANTGQGAGSGVTSGVTVGEVRGSVRAAAKGRFMITGTNTGTGGPASATFAGYPPHGYPCLGCAPCPGNPSEFCDITGISMYVHPGAVKAGWRKRPDGRLVRVAAKAR